ncbi:hypothetical protein OTU49_008800 [Cherax quadricarinatus]|uniref:Uncharacterized protein n=1 Tax=Cherax quadricarinatus TaxID=27406 RepID=A0AAW0WPZ3_CHEQU
MTTIMLVILLVGACVAIPPGRPTDSIRFVRQTKPLPRPQHPQISPTPPAGYQPKPQVDPTPHPGHVIQTLPAHPSSKLTRPAPRPSRHQRSADEVRQGSVPTTAIGKPQTLPPKSQLTKPAVRPQTRPATLPGNLAKPAQRSKSLEDSSFAPLPTGPIVEPRPFPGELTKPASRPIVDPIPPAGELTKPANRPKSVDSGFAPLPTGPIVEPRPPPGELTKPAPRPRPRPGDLTKPATRPRPRPARPAQA